MNVLRLATKKQLKKFVSMPDELYKNDEKFVPYMRGDLLRTLNLLVCKQKSYVALAVEDNGKYVARLLFTIAPSKQLGLDRCGYFSHFECIDDQKVADLLFGEMSRLMKEAGVTHVEGTYFPYDQDNRRGILAEGFADPPMILTSYNPPYYNTLLENCGFRKEFDTVSYKLDYDKYDFTRIDRLTKWVLERYGLYVTHADFSHIDREIDDVHAVIEEATTDVIFQEAPSRDDLVRIVKNWKSFLWEDLVLLVRRKNDGRAVGVMMAIPDYFYVFRKMKGKTNPIALLKALHFRKKITGVRAMLQYVTPAYQNKGVNFALYHEFYKTCKRRHIVSMEAGTIMENNPASRRNVEKASGVVNKIFRIYGKQL